MASKSTEPHDGEGTAGRAHSTQSPPRRPRAPTITIDTSAGDSPNNNPPPHLVDPDDSMSPTDLRPPTAISGSRPVSPHNVSSPTSKLTEQPGNFLSVPANRSRANSSDSEGDDGISPGSVGSDTYVDRGAIAKQPAEPLDNAAIMNDRDALKPDPGQEGDFTVQNNVFAFSPGQLSKLFAPKSLPAFYALGGLRGLEKGLRTNLQSGLSVDESSLTGTISLEEVQAQITDSGEVLPPKVEKIESSGNESKPKSKTGSNFVDRRRIFLDNRLPEKKAKSIFELAWIAYNDKVLILLTIAAVISLAVGIYQSTRKLTPEELTRQQGARVDWVEGVAIVVAIALVVVVGAANDWQKERQFVRLNRKKEDRHVKVIRSGKSQEISVYDVLVGDVMHLEPGDLIPVDGIFISGHGVKCDESSATGESDLLRKESGDTVYKAIENNANLKKLDPFILSGGKVSEGVGTFLVTGVGVHSTYGKTMMSLREESEATPLQSKLNTLAEYIAKLGGAAALLLFIVLFIKFLIQLRHNDGTPAEKGQEFLQILIVCITVVVVAVPEGLPLAVTLALAFATTRMLKDNNLVRLLRSCETMGNATSICSDKTGTLTQNQMTLVAGTIGTTCRFGDKTAKPQSKEILDKKLPQTESVDDVTVNEVVSHLAPEVKEAFQQMIAVNTTAFESEEQGKRIFIGSKTETALLDFARDHLSMGPVEEARSNAEVVQFVPFDSGRKCMAAVVKLSNNKYRMFVKGASEILLAACTQIVRDPTSSLVSVSMNSDNTSALDQVINNYASRSLRTIGLVYRDYEKWPPQGARTSKDDSSAAIFDDVFRHMVFFGVVGIQDPLRDGVKDAVRKCQQAGVFVRMVTGDNIVTARAIAEECGIYTPGGIVMEGPRFRRMTTAQMDQVIPRLQVLARSSPDDKRKLVKRLKELGETVAVTGDGTNDAPALKTADVGFSMGIAGTEVAKEASAIILMDDNFSSIVKALMWGRAVNDAVKKFLQFQITVNITAVILTFVSAVSNDEEQSVLSAVQLLWVNLIMDTFAALALATDPPTPSILNRKPDPKSAPLITINMWKMIIGQAIYQLVVTFILYFGGKTILSYQSDREKNQLGTLVFNTFVWMQIFNQYNNRRLDNRFNIFEGVFRNYFFIFINIVMVAGQVMIVFVGGKAFGVTRLNGAQWAYSVVLGAFSLPVAVVIRLIPDEFIAQMIPASWTRPKHANPDVVVSDDDRRFEWNPAMVEIREELMFLKKLRGGRLRQLKFKLRHPREAFMPSSAIHSRSSSLPRTPIIDNSPEMSQLSGTPDSRATTRRRGRSRSNSVFGAAAMAGIVAGSVGGWSPIDRTHGDTDSLRFGSISGRGGLATQEGVEVHPDTDAKDPVLAKEIQSQSAPPSQVPDLSPDFVADSKKDSKKDKSKK